MEYVRTSITLPEGVYAYLRDPTCANIAGRCSDTSSVILRMRGGE